MNKMRRKGLNQALDLLEEFRQADTKKKAVGKLDECRELVEYICSDEQCCVDSIPEPFQYSRQCEDMNDNVADLEEAVDEIDDIYCELEGKRKFDFKAVERQFMSAVRCIRSAIER